MGDGEMESDEYWMRQALVEAKKAAELNEIPVGAVIVCDGQIIASAHNLRETHRQAVSHAEILAIGIACAKLESWRLARCTIYVTLEPCLMCAGALLQSRVQRLVYGAEDPKAGAVSSLYQTLSDQRLNHQIEVRSGVLGQESKELLQEFFRSLRRAKPGSYLSSEG